MIGLAFVAVVADQTIVAVIASEEILAFAIDSDKKEFLIVFDSDVVEQRLKVLPIEGDIFKIFHQICKLKLKICFLI